jgi:cell division protein FtsN
MDEEPDIPMILNPFIEGYTPIIDYKKTDQEDNVGKIYNGFQVQVISFDNLDEADSIRNFLAEQIVDSVEVIFDAPNYKVRAGAFSDRMDAEELRKKLYRLGYRRSWIVRARLTY